MCHYPVTPPPSPLLLLLLDGRGQDGLVLVHAVQARPLAARALVALAPCQGGQLGQRVLYRSLPLLGGGGGGGRGQEGGGGGEESLLGGQAPEFLEGALGPGLQKGSGGGGRGGVW